MSGGKSKGSERVTQVQQVPPEIQRALSFLVDSSMSLANQYGFPGGRYTGGAGRDELPATPGGVTPFSFGSSAPATSPMPVSSAGGYTPRPVPGAGPLEPYRSMEYPSPLPTVRVGGSNPDLGRQYINDGFNEGVPVSGGGGGKSGGGVNVPNLNLPTGGGKSTSNIVPSMSEDTMAGLGMLRGAFQNNPAVDQLVSTVRGGASNPFTGRSEVLPNNAPTMNPNANVGGREQLAARVGTNTEAALNPFVGTSNRFAGTANTAASGANQYAGSVNTEAGRYNPLLPMETDLSGVTDRITNAARLAVGDRFASAGRSGSGNEGFELAKTISRELAPYAFEARESDAARRFESGENLVGRRTAAEESRIGRLTGTDESSLDRRTMAEQSRIDSLLGTEESRLGRDFGAGEVATDRRFDATENYIDRAIAAQESQLGRQLTVDEERAARQYAAGEAATQRGYDAYGDYLGRDFASQESALTRGFGGYESERGRQLAAIAPLLGIPLQQAQNYLAAGGIVEDQLRSEGTEPFQILDLLTGPLVSAIGGAPRSTTTTGKTRNSFLGFDFNSNLSNLLPGGG